MVPEEIPRYPKTFRKYKNTSKRCRKTTLKGSTKNQKRKILTFTTGKKFFQNKLHIYVFDTNNLPMSNCVKLTCTKTLVVV